MRSVHTLPPDGAGSLWRLVFRPEPSMCTRYFHRGKDSTIQPVLSHFVGLGPHRFCIQTRDPHSNGGRDHVPVDRLSICLPKRSRRAVSLASQVSLHIRAIFGLLKTLMPGGMGIQSRRRHPKRISAGDMPVVGSGVLRYCNKPATTQSSPSAPSALALHCSSLFIDFTATSALPLLSGLYADGESHPNDEEIH